MKSTFHNAILALALSVSAAPVEKYSSANKGVHSSTHSLTARDGPSGGHWYDEASGPPVFFGDEPSTNKGPARDDHDDAEDFSPSFTHSEPGTPTEKESAVTIPAVPLFGTIIASASTSWSTHISSSTHTKNTHTSTTRTKHTHASTTHTKSSASSTHTSSSKPNKPHKSTPENQALAPARLVTPNYKSYIAKAGTLMWGMQNPVCSAVTLIFARGTTEVGNMGTCVGPDLAEELRKRIPSLSVQGVDYPANSAGDTRYGASGGPYMAMLAREARLQCPDTKIVLAGYSQGARCIHGALEKSERPFDGEDVAAVVAFGDPLNGRNSFKGVDREDVLQVCGDSDDRCQHAQVDMWVHGGHVSYGKSAEDVAKWIQRKVE